MREELGAVSCTRLRCVLTQTPAPRPGTRLRRGRAEARAPVARKLCLLAPGGRGAQRLSICVARQRNAEYCTARALCALSQ
ncbi:hypothetical protein C7T86_02625 [Xanthomonas citri pv. malvacearum]|uniref:Uncharacterized protein n=1 Tax=Xanthomonas campestris pv. malvacearum TaxID=86040 RepID=A0AA44Z4S5_XANCM|nr:hypothetical protein CIW71_06550 [Xanthomonas citri pv. malvacearum]ASY88084.1 hypothetical protein CIW72_06420 [Xanthomonas citri pv. malvacearum]NMI12548.1 hypothetical protein [Xanthomonas citri]PUE96325.1 hypothetical protein C7T86_02625 [Xanthomonas citri pv. malvacearum]